MQYGSRRLEDAVRSLVQVTSNRKTSDEDDAMSMANFVHQALVRTNVVLELIQGAKSRGQCAYLDVDMDRARELAKTKRPTGMTDRAHRRLCAPQVLSARATEQADALRRELPRSYVCLHWYLHW